MARQFIVSGYNSPDVLFGPSVMAVGLRRIAVGIPGGWSGLITNKQPGDQMNQTQKQCTMIFRNLFLTNGTVRLL